MYQIMERVSNKSLFRPVMKEERYLSQKGKQIGERYRAETYRIRREILRVNGKEISKPSSFIDTNAQNVC